MFKKYKFIKKSDIAHTAIHPLYKPRLRTQQGDKFKGIRNVEATAGSIEASIGTLLIAIATCSRDLEGGRGCIERPGCIEQLFRCTSIVAVVRRASYSARAFHTRCKLPPPCTLLFISCF
ncbi:unnamed protein product [Colias eurytheme]|nr:unnamed protein product [Colias eurytheme]